MAEIMAYQRAAAVAHAHRWAYGRDPRYLDFQELGGDCTNFASQCLLAGAGVMNYAPTFGWYYNSSWDRAPAWTGVHQLYHFLTRKDRTPGPFALEVDIEEVRPGDLVQISFVPGRYGHCPIVVAADRGEILVAAHSEDTDNRPLSSYPAQAVRFLHIVGVNI